MLQINNLPFRNYHHVSELGAWPSIKYSYVRFVKKKILMTMSMPSRATKGRIRSVPGFIVVDVEELLPSSSSLSCFFIRHVVFNDLHLLWCIDKFIPWVEWRCPLILAPFCILVSDGRGWRSDAILVDDEKVPPTGKASTCWPELQMRTEIAISISLIGLAYPLLIFGWVPSSACKNLVARIETNCLRPPRTTDNNHLF